MTYPQIAPARCPGFAAVARGLCVLVAASAFVAPALAQEEAGELEPELSLETLAPAAMGEGTISGHVFDSATGDPVQGVEVELVFPAPEAGAEPSTQKTMTDAEGAYGFDAVPMATYNLRFSKPGFRNARLAELAVLPNQMNPADFAMTAEAAAPEGVEEIIVTGKIQAPEASRELSDEMINTMDAGDIGKFAASDIGDAIKRIPGINVVEGQFAIIRGLEDRYSSTLFNGAPVPSPDPDTQSVQLDLFPSEVASNLVVAKTFAPDLPSNSSGGSINIITHEYPEELEIKLSAGSGFNENSTKRFIEYRDGSPIGRPTNGNDTVEGDFGASLAGRTHLGEREIRGKLAFNWERDYDTKTGVQEGREPRKAQTRLFPLPATTTVSGDLSLGELNLSAGRFDYTESGEVTQTTGIVDLGFDLDEEGNHTVNFSGFYTQKEAEVVQLRENGFVPGLDYSVLGAKAAIGQSITFQDYELFATQSSWIARVREDTFDVPSRGPLWFANFTESRSFAQDRDLLVFQLNGEHLFDVVHGLRITWAANRAKTTQDEGYFSARYFYEPTDTQQNPSSFPVEADDLGPGQYGAGGGIFLSTNQVEETQDFGRLDIEYESDLTDWLSAKINGGAWYELADRDVGATFLENPNVGASSQFAILAADPLALGDAIPAELDRLATGAFSGLRSTSNDSSREILAFDFGLKVTLFEDLDLLAGVRRERIIIESRNDPFTGESALDGTMAIFPTKYLFFDRLDNAARGECSPCPGPGASFNDQLIGIDVPIDPNTGLVDLLDRAAIEEFVNGEIDDTHALPSVGVTYRPLDGLNLRAAYSRTVARPAFREIGYYVTVEPGSDDLVIGNPQLDLSRVESWDVRAEYLWGEGDLAAVSLFQKAIEDPIESIVIRNPQNTSGGSSALFRTFFNNPDEASLWGLELEGRKAFDFVGVDALEYLSIAANFTYIDAKVDRTETELTRAAGFFGTAAGDDEKFEQLEKSRRLYNQPEWIANADLTFDHPDWGTRLTLAFFAISDVLDAAGSATESSNGGILSLTLDRYIDSFYQLDLVLSQRWAFDRIPGDLTFKASAKNLTDSTRRLLYDPAQTSSKIAERSFKIGRDVSLAVSYSLAF